jgi:hypothetical protein
MDKAFSNLLNHIDKLTLTKKEQVYQWVKRYVDPSYSVGGRLINEMRETRFVTNAWGAYKTQAKEKGIEN